MVSVAFIYGLTTVLHYGRSKARYIRPIFLIILAYFAYKRSWKGLVITFVVMMSSMVWFPAPKAINLQMEAVLDFEKKLLSNPITALATFAFSIGTAF